MNIIRVDYLLILLYGIREVGTKRGDKLLYQWFLLFGNRVNNV